MSFIIYIMMYMCTSISKGLAYTMYMYIDVHCDTVLFQMHPIKNPGWICRNRKNTCTCIWYCTVFLEHNMDHMITLYNIMLRDVNRL